LKKSELAKKSPGVLLIIGLWAVVVFLLFPLFTLDNLDMSSAAHYVYRSAVGIGIMIILFGKTVFDLFLPLGGSNKRLFLQSLFLALYAMLIAGGIIFMVARLVTLYIQSQSAEISF